MTYNEILIRKSFLLQVLLLAAKKPWAYVSALRSESKKRNNPECYRKNKSSLQNSRERELVDLRVFHPCNTVEIAQASFIFRGWWRVHARTVSSPAALLCVRGSGDVDVQALRKQPLKDTATLTSLEINHLRHDPISDCQPKILSSWRSEQLPTKQLSTYQFLISPRCSLLLQGVNEFIGI